MWQPKPINERTEEDVSPRLAHCTDQRVEPGESTCPVPLAARMRAPRTKQFATHHLQVELLVRAQAIHAWPNTAQGHPLARLDVPLHFLCDKAIHLRSLQGTPTWHASTAGSATRAPTTATANGTNTPAWQSHERSQLLTDASAQRYCRCDCRCHGRGLDQRPPQLRARHHDRTSQGRRVVAHQPAAAGTAGAWSPPASAASESAVCCHHTRTVPQGPSTRTPRSSSPAARTSSASMEPFGTSPWADTAGSYLASEMGAVSTGGACSTRTVSGT